MLHNNMYLVGMGTRSTGLPDFAGEDRFAEPRSGVPRQWFPGNGSVAKLAVDFRPPARNKQNLGSRDNTLVRKKMTNPSSTLSLPNPKPLLLTMGALVAWVLLSSDAGPEGIWLIVALLLPVAGAIMYFLANRPDVGILVLCVAAAMPRFY